MKKTTIFGLILVAIISFFPLSSWAMNIESSDNVFIPQDKVIEGNLYTAAKNITVEGAINGDLIAAAQNINIKGRITGDVLSISQNLNVDGEVEGNIRSIVAESTTINNVVGKNLNILSDRLILGTGAQIGWDALIGTALTEIRGKINGELNGFTDRLILAGTIDKDVNLRIHNLEKENYKNIEFLEGAIINGDFNYSSSKTIDVNKEKIAGNLNFKEIKKEKDIKNELWGLIVSIFSALIIGLILTSLFKNFLQKIIDKVEKNWGKNLLFGLVVLILAPLAAIFLAITIIGFPLSLIILTIWLVSLYLSKIIFAVYIGNLIRERLFKTKHNNLMKSLLLGVPVVWIIFEIPVIGNILAFFSILLILGVLWNYRIKIFK